MRALYKNKINDFIIDDNDSILGIINRNYHGSLLDTTRDAWKGEIEILKENLSKLDTKSDSVIFEYEIPRLRKRIDVVLLIKGIIFVLEFKVGQRAILDKDIDQVLDYALDLRYFHEDSENKIIVPILIPTETEECSNLIIESIYDKKVLNPLITGKKHLFELINKVINRFPNEENLDIKWVESRYVPTPTIIEAARTLYSNHTVENITKHEADKATTEKVINKVLEVIEYSKKEKKKSICFVTGVPGAGKTLVGLEIAVRQTYQDNNVKKDDGAVYLSGNGPLVAVLTEALARDDNYRCKQNENSKKLSDSRREVGKFIQVIHKYRDNMLEKIKNPVENEELEIDPQKAREVNDDGYAEVEHVAIFDEAQRSWTQKKLANYLKKGGTYGNKIKVPNFPMSEAAFLIWSLDQRKDWATIVCLVGGGQEINTGEAGIYEWIKALNDRFPNWNIYISSKLTDLEYAEGNLKELLENNKNVNYYDDLHLSVSMRSFRAEKLSDFVYNLLALEKEKAKEIYKEIKDKYPIILTRDMEKAKRWLHERANGSIKTGVLVTKESARFKPLGIHILQKRDIDAVHWFLEDKTDVRSSNYLEDAATEIQVQGLELDYACVLWDADMRYEDKKWNFYTFNGQTEWKKQNLDNDNSKEFIKYMLNAYRVLLTRSRIGMIICVPKGNSNKSINGLWEDSTRLPEYYDGTYEYLKSIGLEEI